MRERRGNLFAALSDDIPKPANAYELESFFENISTKISNYFYGFFNVSIAPKDSNRSSLGDITTQRVDLKYFDSDTQKETSL